MSVNHVATAALDHEFSRPTRWPLCAEGSLRAEKEASRAAYTDFFLFLFGRGGGGGRFGRYQEE